MATTGALLEAALRSFWNDRVIGYCWWDWKSQLYERRGKNQQRTSALRKAAEQVLRKWYPWRANEMPPQPCRLRLTIVPFPHPRIWRLGT